MSNAPILPALLFVAFLVLKLCHVISWSWWWITAPLWLLPSLFLLFFVVTYLLTRPRTPAQKLSAACDRMARAVRAQSR